MHLSETDHARVSAAVTAAEATTDGEIIVIVADQSDAYHDVALHWSLLVMLLAMAVYASFPEFYMGLIDRMTGGWRHDWTPRALLTFVLLAATLKFLATRLILAWRPLRLALTPAATKARRVRRRAIALFRASAEKRTASRTGVLLYLSLAEHRAEIVADAAIHALVPNSAWGEAMAMLIDDVREDRPGDGLARAVTAIGATLASHFPRSGRDPNELPDKVIEL